MHVVVLAVIHHPGASHHRRKQAEVGVRLEELGMEGQEQRLQDAVASPSDPPYRLARLVSEITQMQVGTGWCVMPGSSTAMPCCRQTQHTCQQVAGQCGKILACLLPFKQELACSAKDPDLI
jgi:hypothetical protein